ncbi:unnamed protein product, partial [Prorocentrum cordatum]
AAAATLAPRQKQPRGGPKEAVGKESGPGDHNDEEIMPMQKLTLDNAQMIRQLSGSLWDFFLIPGEHSAVAAAVAAGTTYAEQAKEKNNKDLGPPHLHIGVDFFLEMGLNDKAEGANKTILTEFRTLIDVLGMQGFGGIVSYFKVKKAYSEDQINAIREGNQGPHVKISRTTQIGDLRKAIVDTLRAAGAEQIFGAPPPSGLERKVQAALRARQLAME